MTTSLARGDIFNPEGFRVHAGGLIVSSFAINILSLALPVMTLQIYDRVLPNPGSGTLPVLIVGVCIAIVLEALLRLARSYVLGWSGAAYEHRMSCQAMEHLLAADLSRLSAAGVGELMHRLNAVGKLKDFHNGYSLMTLSELGFVPVYLGVMIYIIGPLAVVPTVVLMAFTLVSLAQGQKLRAALERRDHADDERYNFLIESLDGVHTIKAFALENNFARRYEAMETDSCIANFRVTQAMSGTFNTGTVFSHVMVAAVIAVGALCALHGQITTGALIAAVLLSGRMMQPIQRALALWTRYQDYLLARAKVETLYDTPQYMPVALAGEDQPRDGSIQFNHVTFRPNPAQAPVLEDVSFSLQRGDSVLLRADDQESKLALLELIAGMYPATAGSVKIDGLETGRYAPEKLIRRVGFLQTEGLIFRGTIRDNLTCFGQIPESEAQEIANLLKLNRDIAGLASGFDTFLTGSGQDVVTPGLKQRIAMARVLAPKPRIILFDSADRSLDRDGYNLVYNLLARLRGRVTMVLVSDDRNIRGLATKAMALRGGRLSFEELHQSTGSPSIAGAMR